MVPYPGPEEAVRIAGRDVDLIGKTGSMTFAWQSQKLLLLWSDGLKLAKEERGARDSVGRMRNEAGKFI